MDYCLDAFIVVSVENFSAGANLQEKENFNWKARCSTRWEVYNYEIENSKLNFFARIK